MSLETRLAKLESQTERIVRCAWCRYSLVPDSQASDGKPLLASDYKLTTCRWCGNKFKQTFRGLTTHQKESLILWSHAFDGATYQDERAFAAMCWWEFHWKKQALLKERGRAAKNPGGKLSSSSNHRRNPKKQTRFEREREELKEQANALMQKAYEQEAELYGERSFPLIEQLKKLDDRNLSYMFDGNERRSDEEEAALKFLNIARCMEACEVVIWGEADPETKAEIEDRTLEASALKEKRIREKREKDEEAERKRIEREREREERLAATSVNPAPSSPMVAEPIEPEWLFSLTSEERRALRIAGIIRTPDRTTISKK